MDRTIVTQLHPTPEQKALLDRTMQEHTACFNAVARAGFEIECINSIIFRKRTYYPLRAQYPDLPAQLVCAARVKAAEAVKSALTWKKKHANSYPKRVAKATKQGRPLPTFKPVRCPQSARASIRYDKNSYWVKWDRMTASLASVSGRLEILSPFLNLLGSIVGGRPALPICVSTTDGTIAYRCLSCGSRA